MRFSRRAGWDLTPNPLAARMAERLEQGLPLVDLTAANPTAAGLAYPEEDILAALSDRRGLRYAPDPKGLPEARAAVAAYYGERGAPVSPEQILLTASTSEAYGAVFKLLCDPGDVVLVPEPSYPLFGFLAGLEGVEARPYPLVLSRGFRIDLDAVADALADPAVRALVVVSPNNPTGTFVKRGELDALSELLREREVALIADEVFADYARRPDPHRVSTAAAPASALTFTLSGLSKVLGLPQLKLGWMVVSGPEPWAVEARARLEVVLDTYLSVSASAQHAAAPLFALRTRIQDAIKARLTANLDLLARAVGGIEGAVLLPSEGGWYAVIALPERVDETQLGLRLLVGHGVLIHPGHFFDFPHEPFVVTSLLLPSAGFAQGLRALAQEVAAC